MRVRKELPEGPWKPVRAHECYSGPYFNIEPEERAEYDARPFIGIEAADGTRLVCAHDCFEFKPGVAELFAAVPELLEALRSACDALHESGQEWAYCEEGNLCPGCAAISKGVKL